MTAPSRTGTSRAASGDGGGGFGGGGTAPIGQRAAEDLQRWDSELAAGEDVLAQAAAEHASAEEALARERSAWPAEPEVSYLNAPETFQADYDQARERQRRGEDPVPYMLEDATGGLGARDGGRGFGVELEFDFGPEMGFEARQAAKAAIARDLHAAGLSRHSSQGGYHASQQQGYTDDPGSWRLESDSTVAGEVVSPIMYDEPATWQNLASVCQIVRRHGGTASLRTGGHVHVGLSDYDHTVDNHNRLLRTAAAYRDTVYRLAQNPAARAHRGATWCAPNRDPGPGYATIAHARQANTGHSLGMNFQSVQGSRSDHVEYRMWDGSLSPSVIQTQIKLSLGLTAAAARGGYQPPAAAEQLGAHRARQGPRPRRLSGEAWQDNTRSFRALADTVFRRAADKAQATALFAVTRWQR